MKYFHLNYNTDTDNPETEISELEGIYEITDEETLLDLVGTPIVLNRYKDDDMYNYLLKKIVDICALCWNNLNDRGEKLQRTLIQVKVDVDDVQTLVMPLNKFMMNLVFLGPLMEYLDMDIDINDYIIEGPYLTDKRRNIIHNNTARTLMEFGDSIGQVHEKIAHVSLYLKELLLIFSYADMQIFTAENLFLDHYRESELIREINNTVYPPSMQTKDIVEENSRKYKLLEAEMLRRGNPFFVDNKYTQIVKPKQMEELYINFSQIPDGKEIIPVIMNGNGFNQGYHDIPVLYAGAIAARVPDIMNNEFMGPAGYFGRNLWILTYGTISKTVWDCGSRNLIPVVIDEVELEMKHGRFYAESQGFGVHKVLKRTDKHLIGKTLYFRSPCTCNLNEDVCHMCYGTVALKVGNLSAGFIYSTELMTSEVAQKILSAKHLLKTNAEKIEFEGDYEKYFSLENSNLIVTDEKKFDIYIREDFSETVSEKLTFYIGKDLIPITLTNYSMIYVPDKIIDASKEVEFDEVRYHKISNYKIIEMGGVICEITPINIMMTDKYFKIMRLFENEISKYNSIEEVVKVLTNLLYKTIGLLSVHGEIIISHLIRDIDNKLLRPDWLVPDQKYQLLNLKTALTNSESFTSAMSFQETRHHLLDKIFDKRNAVKRVGPSSFADYLFGEEWA